MDIRCSDLSTSVRSDGAEDLSLETDTCTSSRFELFFRDSNPTLDQPVKVQRGRTKSPKTPENEPVKSKGSKRHGESAFEDHSYVKLDGTQPRFETSHSSQESTAFKEPLHNSLEKLRIDSKNDVSSGDIPEVGAEVDIRATGVDVRPEAVGYNHDVQIGDIEGDKRKSPGDIADDNESKVVTVEEVKSERFVSYVDEIELDTDFDTALHLAIIHNISFCEIGLILLKYIFRHGRLFRESINVQNRLGQTPLHLAVLMGRVDLVKLLKAVGAWVNIRDRRLRTPMFIACEINRIDILQSLLDGHSVEAIRSFSSQLDIPDSEGMRCVHEAVISGNVDMLKVLVQHGADVNKIERKGGKTALHLAAEAGNTDIVRYLLTLRDIDGDIRTYGPSGCTALELAYLRGHRNLVSLLRHVTMEPNRKRRRVDEEETDG